VLSASAGFTRSGVRLRSAKNGYNIRL